MVTMKKSQAYYNECEPYAAQWLRNLIDKGHIAPGIVDERSIEDVVPNELLEFTQCHFFAGIGIWSHALRNAGWADERPVWTGSCPCQPFSSAGKGEGFDDERHLWPHWHHLIAECSPANVFGEQVAGKDGLYWLDLVQADLEGTGYACGAIDHCAAGFGAPNIRQRLYFAAERLGDGCSNGWGAGRRDNTENDRNIPDPTNAVGRVDHPERSGLERRARQSERPEGRQTPVGPSEQGSGVGGLAHMQGVRQSRPATGQKHDRRVGTASDSCGSSNRLANTGNSGCRQAAQGGTAARRHGPIGNGGATSGKPATGPVNGLWADADWLYGQDGKWRPVEPGTFPLAHGYPQRVGRLRAYGNGLNAAQAQGFIEAFMECEPGRAA